MAELVVVGYESPEKAEEVRQKLLDLQKEYLVDVADAVVATKDEKGQVKLSQMVHLWSVGAASGSFWGLLVGLLFLQPLLGVVAGAAAGAIGGALSDAGIDDNFMKDVAQVLQPGQAALFVLARRVSGDRVVEALAPYGGRVIRTNLDTEQEQKLRDALAHARAHVAHAEATQAGETA
jgi:uncharacterized membrane protein